MLQQSNSDLKNSLLSQSHSHHPHGVSHRADSSARPVPWAVVNQNNPNASLPHAQLQMAALEPSPASTHLDEENIALSDTSTVAGTFPSGIPTNRDSLVTPPDASGSSSQDPDSQGFIPVLKNRNFLALWSGQVFSQLADKVYLVLMIALIDSHFHTKTQPISAWVSAIMIAFTIPAVLFGSLAGVFVDRWSKRIVLAATNLLRGSLVLILPLLFWLAKDWGNIAGLPVGFYLLLLVTFLVSTLTQFFAPAEQAAIPLIVEKRHLLSANSLYTTTMMASVIVGFAVGQPLLDLADSLMARLGWSNGKELIVGGSYAIAGLLLLLLETKEKVPAEHEVPHIFADLKDGLRYLKHSRRVRTALIQLVILFSVFAALSVLAVRLAEVIPGLKPSQFGFLMAAGGVGMGISAAILGHWGQGISHTWLSLVGSAGVSAALLGLALLPHKLWLVLLLVMLLGGFGAIVAVPMQTTIQKETPAEMRGKVFGLQNNAINIALTLPLALAGVAETLFGLKVVFLALAAAAIAGALIVRKFLSSSSKA
jgi:MFS family permease